MGESKEHEKQTIEAACPCGNARLKIHAPPRFRMYCHCTICQRFNQAPFADVLIYRAKDVDLPESGAVEIDTYKPLPTSSAASARSAAQRPSRPSTSRCCRS